jgi:hypothetical protein
MSRHVVDRHKCLSFGGCSRQTQIPTCQPRSVNKIRPDGVFRLLGGQMNSAASTETRIRKTRDSVWICQEFEVQGGALSEVRVNWSTFPSLANLASWLCDDIPDIQTHEANNRHDRVAHYQPKGTATFAGGELVRYMKQKGANFCGLGRWCSSLFYSNPNHRTRVVVAYNVGRQSPKRLKSIYQQQLRRPNARTQHDSFPAIPDGLCGANSSLATPG